MTTSGTIRTGIGGWTFDPWEGHFYPADIKKAKQLAYASSKLKTIEINGTYYSSQKPATFAKWAADVPDGFVFSLKAIRYATNRRVLAEAGESVEKFLASGVSELGDHLGPILWQFMPTKKFDEEDFGAFLALLPEKQDGLKLRHAVEVRNPSFMVPEFVALARRYNVAIVYAEHFDYPEFADVTADFVYARLQKGSDDVPTCYEQEKLDEWAGSFKLWAAGDQPADLPCVVPDEKPERKPRDVFGYFITSGKVNAPMGAMALQEKVS